MSQIASMEVNAYVKNARAIIKRYGIDDSKYNDDEVLEKYAMIRDVKAANVQVLSRGEATEQMLALLSFVPKGFIGEFKRNTPMDQQRAKAIGWSVFVNEDAAKLSPTGEADSVVRIADSILMVMPEENYIAIRMSDEERKRRAREARNPQKEAEEANKQGNLAPLMNLR